MTRFIAENLGPSHCEPNAEISEDANGDHHQ
jgi:hypothetical protein